MKKKIEPMILKEKNLLQMSQKENEYYNFDFNKFLRGKA